MYGNTQQFSNVLALCLYYSSRGFFFFLGFFLFKDRLLLFIFKLSLQIGVFTCHDCLVSEGFNTFFVLFVSVFS